MTIHKDDKQIMYQFIDNVRLRGRENIGLESSARHVAEHIGINPNVPNAKLANKFASMLEANVIS